MLRFFLFIGENNMNMLNAALAKGLPECARERAGMRLRKIGKTQAARIDLVARPQTTDKRNI